MDDDKALARVIMNTEERKKANEYLWLFVQSTMNVGTAELKGLRVKLSITYWVIISLSVVTFIIGAMLLSVPVVGVFRNDIDLLKSITAAGFGIMDLAGLFLFRPIERIHGIMGDMSQITLALNSFQTQVGLRLMEMDVTDRPTIGITAEFIGKAAEGSIKLVQDYCQDK